MIEFSIVLPTYNRYKSLVTTLNSLTKSLEGFENWELIIIDNNSSDGTFDYCANRFKYNNRIKILNNNVRSAYVSRNIGIRTSIGRYLIFFEDDLIIPREWFPKINRVINEYPDKRIFTYNIKSSGTFSKIITGIHEFEKQRLLMHGKLTGCIQASSFLIKREVFDDIGLFHETCRGGDNEFTLRLIKNNENVQFIQDIFVYHEFVNNIRDFLKRSFAYGYSFSENGSYRNEIADTKQSLISKILKNVRMPFVYAIAIENNYLLTLVFSFVYEIAFIFGGFCHKRFLNKNPVV